MAKFLVKAGTMEGKVLNRVIESDSVDGIRGMLEKEGLLALDIRQRSLSIPLLKSGQKVKGIDLLVFSQGLVTLLRAGLPVVDSLDILRRGAKNVALAKALECVVRDIRSGKAISEALGLCPYAFPSLYSATVAAGEKTGDLIPAMLGYIDFQKRTEEIRKKVLSSALYPAILAFASLFVVCFLIYFVVPSFSAIYESSGAQLPLGTRVLMAVAHALKSHIVLIAAIAAGAVILITRYLRTEKGRGLLDTIKVRAPWLGEIYQGYAIAKFSRTLGMLLRSGVPLPEALRMSKGVLGNLVLEKKLEGVVDSVIGGGSASEAMEACGLLPEITLRMFNAGERSASLPQMLNEIAIFHEGDLDYKVGMLTGVLEPALMIIMGLLIGGIVVLMYMPIFQLGAGI